MFTRSNRVAVAAVIAVIIATTSGCASTAPKAKFSHDLASASRVGVSDVAQVTVDAPDSVKIMNSEKARLAEKIQKKIDDRKVANAGERRGQEL